MSVEHMSEVLAAGVSPQQVLDALAFGAAFNITDRLAETFGFGLLSARRSRKEPSTSSSGGYR